FAPPAPASSSTLSLHDALPIFEDGQRGVEQLLAALLARAAWRVPAACDTRHRKYGTVCSGWHRHLPSPRPPRRRRSARPSRRPRSEEHTSELQSRVDLVCRLLL